MSSETRIEISPSIEVGSRWFAWGQERVVVDVKERLYDGEVELWVCAPLVARSGRKPHWTDWIRARTLDRKGMPLRDGEKAPRQTTGLAREEIVERAVAEAREEPMRGAITPQRRLRNKITSTRYRMKHPEKSGRDSWAPAELADMQATMDDAARQLKEMAA